MTVFVPLTYAALEISDGTVQALYHLDDDVVDASGNGYNGTENGGISYVAGLLDNAIDLGTGNSTDYMSYSGNLGIAGQGAMSVAFWWKRPSEISSGSDYPWGHRSTTSADRYIQPEYAYNGGTRRITINAANSFIHYNTTLGTDWNHIVITRTAAGAVTLFLNGSSVASGSQGFATAGQNHFMAGTESGAAYADGIIDEIVIFNTAIDSDTVDLLYNDGSGNAVCVDEGCAPAEESSGGTSIYMENKAGYTQVLLIVFLFSIIIIGYVGIKTKP